MKTKCQEFVDKGASRIRGFHNTRPCEHPAKYRVTYGNGRVEFLCGIHANALLKKDFDIRIEKLVEEGETE